MNAKGLAAAYFTDISEVETALGLPLLGRLAGETRFYQLQDGLANLAPDSRVSERLYRLIAAEPLCVWVVGLGEAGEEIPIAVGIAERAAALGGGPAVIAEPEGPQRDAARRPGPRPVHAPGLDAALQAVYPRGYGVLPSDIQGVFRACSGKAAKGRAVKPAALILSSAASHEAWRPLPDELSSVVLVVPFKDQPRERIIDQVSGLREAGYSLAGFVGFGPLGSTSGGGPAGAAPERRRANVAGGCSGNAEREAGSVEGSQSAREPAGGSRAGVELGRSWSESFGPRRRRGGFFARRRPSGSRQPPGSRRNVPWGWLAGGLMLVVVALLVVPWLLKERQAKEPDGSETGAIRAERVQAEPVQADAGTTPTSTAVEQAPGEGQIAVAARTGESRAGETAASEPAAAVPVSETADVEAQAAAAATEAAAMARVVPVIAEEGNASAPEIRDMVASFAGPFAVLCGSFRSEERAAAEVGRLSSMGLEARKVAVRIPQRGLWHRVIVGSAASQEGARETAQTIADSGWVPVTQVIAGAGYGRVVTRPIHVPSQGER